VLGKIYLINFWQSGKDSGSQNDFLIKLPEPQREANFGGKTKIFRLWLGEKLRFFFRYLLKY